MKALALSMMIAWALWGSAAFGQEAGGVGGLDADGDGVADCNMGMRHGFVDADGDGINDLSQDADGDGTPNGMDPDYAATGRWNHGRGGMGHHVFVDEDGDGINDLSQDADGDGTLNGMDPDYALPEGVGRSGGHHGGRGMMGGMMGSGNAAGDQTSTGTSSAALRQRQAPAPASRAGLQQEGSRRMRGMGQRMGHGRR